MLDVVILARRPRSAWESTRTGSTTFTVSPYTYLGPPGVGLFTFPPGMTETGFATFAGTPTRAGTFHTFVILNDQTDLVIDTLTVTVLP